MIDQYGFKEECLLITRGDIFIYDLDLEPWELSNILQYITLEGTNWLVDDFSVEGCKVYDEDGNSTYIGLLQVNTKGRNTQDLRELSLMWNAAELIWQKKL